MRLCRVHPDDYLTNTPCLLRCTFSDNRVHYPLQLTFDELTADRDTLRATVVWLRAEMKRLRDGDKVGDYVSFIIFLSCIVLAPGECNAHEGIMYFSSLD